MPISTARLTSIIAALDEYLDIAAFRDLSLKHETVHRPTGADSRRRRNT